MPRLGEGRDNDVAAVMVEPMHRLVAFMGVPLMQLLQRRRLLHRVEGAGVQARVDREGSVLAVQVAVEVTSVRIRMIIGVGFVRSKC